MGLRYFLEIAFDGSAYHGWQRQPQSISVQQVIEKTLSTLLRQPLTITGAGRTDAGVHASQLYAHFDVELAWSAKDCEELVHRLNRFLPPAIAIHNLLPVLDDAHARFDALARTYRYRICTRKSPFLVGSAYFVHQNLNLSAMEKASEYLLGKQDFKCFSRSNTDVKTYICNVSEAKWKKLEEELIFEITADRFLRNMVRAVVGTLVEIGLEKYTPEHMLTIIDSQNRSQAGPSVPAHGLYLTRVIYPDNLFKTHVRD